MYDQQTYIRNTLLLENQELLNLYSQSLQNVATRVDLAFKAFFRRVKSGGMPGYPRFKGRQHYDSYTYPQNNGSFKFVNRKIYLSKIGHVNVIQHRSMLGNPKTCTVKRSSTGKWFVFIVCENVPQTKLEPNTNEVGIDLGISSFATFSNQTKIENPKFFKSEEKELKKSQRRKKKKVTAIIHERIHNKRYDFIHKLTKHIVKIFHTICVEDLSINKMIRNGKVTKLSKSIQDVAWGMFTSILSNKAENAGRTLVLVNPAYSSQDCCICLTRQKIDLSVRVYECNTCGLIADRDWNAAVNILTRGLASLVGA
jgi:putative transposase